MTTNYMNGKRREYIRWVHGLNADDLNVELAHQLIKNKSKSTVDATDQKLFAETIYDHLMVDTDIQRNRRMSGQFDVVMKSIFNHQPYENISDPTSANRTRSIDMNESIIFIIGFWSGVFLTIFFIWMKEKK